MENTQVRQDNNEENADHELKDLAKLRVSQMTLYIIVKMKCKLNITCRQCCTLYMHN